MVHYPDWSKSANCYKRRSKTYAFWRKRWLSIPARQNPPRRRLAGAFVRGAARLVMRGGLKTSPVQHPNRPGLLACLPRWPGRLPLALPPFQRTPAQRLVQDHAPHPNIHAKFQPFAHTAKRVLQPGIRRSKPRHFYNWWRLFSCGNARGCAAWPLQWRAVWGSPQGLAGPDPVCKPRTVRHPSFCSEGRQVQNLSSGAHHG